MYIQHLSLQASKQAKAADPFLCPIHGPSHRLPDCRRRRLKYGTPVGPTGPDRGCVIPTTILLILGSAIVQIMLIGI